MAKLPSFQFYPGDWLKDPAVRSVSLSARGLWIDMLCLMHESDRRGYLQHATGKPVTAQQLARMTGCSTDDVSRLLQELSDSGVFSCTDNEVIYSRRIVRDEKKRQLCSEAGKRGGGNPTFKGRFKGEAKGVSKGPPKQKPKASSSSSTSNIKTYTPLPPTGGSGGDPPYEDLFEIFYRAYPRHENPEKARTAFKKSGITGEKLPKILRWIEIAKQSDQWQQRDKIPYASTFLNQKRWKGDPPPRIGRLPPDTIGQSMENTQQQPKYHCERCEDTGKLIAIFASSNGHRGRTEICAPWSAAREKYFRSSPEFAGREIGIFRCSCEKGNHFREFAALKPIAATHETER